MTNENDAFMEKINSISLLFGAKLHAKSNWFYARPIGFSRFTYLPIVFYVQGDCQLDWLFGISITWNSIKDIDSNYFLDNKNIDHIYENYEFPILAESNNFKDIKHEIKVIDRL
jgi:hypothetical protein